MTSTLIHAGDERAMPFSPEQIWPIVADVAGYPNWYPRSVRLRVVPTTAEGRGSELEIRPWGGRPFRCHVESVEPPHWMMIRYGGGYIEGTGEWRLEARAGGSRVVYDFKVEAKGQLVALLGLALPLARIHSRLMRDILHHLECEVSHRSNAR